MSATLMHCALAVQAIYKNREFADFQLMQGFYDPKNTAVKDTAYSVGLYKFTGAFSGDFTGNGTASMHIVAFRGSAKKFTTKDWVDDDVSIGLGRTPDRTNDCFKHVVAWTKIHSGVPALLVGHSLGGHLAQYVGTRLGLPFVTFNAPPALGTFSGCFADGTQVGNFRQGLNFRVNYDPVSRAPGRFVGPVVTLPLSGQKHAAAHTAGVVVKALKASGLAAHDALREIALRN